MARKPRPAIAAMTRVTITGFMSRPFAGAWIRPNPLLPWS